MKNFWRGCFVRVAVLGLVVTASCQAPPQDPYRPIARLRGMIAVGPPGRFGWDCGVGDELRPAVGCSRIDQLLHDVRPFPVGAASTPARADVPQALVGKPLIVQTKIVARRATSWVTRQTIFYPAAPAHLDLAIPLDGVTTDKASELRVLIEARAVYPEKQSWVTRKIAVPPEAIFTTGIALEDLGLGTPEAVTSIRIRAVGEDLDELLYEGELRPDDAAGWRDLKIDLSAFAGRKIRFAFDTEWQTPGIAFPLFGAPLVLARAKREKARNVILVSLDTLRGDHIEKFHEKIPLMPELAAFAAEGALFERAFSAYPSTSASHMTLFTSTYPVVHQVTFANQLAPRWLAMLTEVFAAGGYATGAVTENAMLAAHSGFARGFDTYLENKGLGKWESAGEAEATFAAGIDWIEAHRDEVFFLFLHTYEVHSPYTPPADVALPKLPKGAPIAEVKARQYQGEVRHTDRLLAEVFRKIEDLGLAEDTIIVVTSDHGEAFGEHGHVGHSWMVYDEFVHVPLIFWGPGAIAPGKRIQAQTSLIDVAPTLFELTGLPQPTIMTGQSLGALLRGETTSPPEDFIYLEAPKGKKPKAGRVFAARSEKYKFIGREFLPEPLEIYNLQSDPGEKKNLIGIADEALLAEARAVLGRYRALDAEAKTRDGQGNIKSEVRTRTLDSATQKKLKALGYVD
ncbi:MAG: sulfatase [Deltaproteobacteria bacterium]